MEVQKMKKQADGKTIAKGLKKAIARPLKGWE